MFTECYESSNKIVDYNVFLKTAQTYISLRYRVEYRISIQNNINLWVPKLTTVLTPELEPINEVSVCAKTP